LAVFPLQKHPNQCKYRQTQPRYIRRFPCDVVCAVTLPVALMAIWRNV
jgi:hypothetical protein